LQPELAEFKTAIAFVKKANNKNTDEKQISFPSGFKIAIAKRDTRP